MKKMFYVFLLLVVSTVRAQNFNVQFSEKFSLRDQGMSEKDGFTLRKGDFFYCLDLNYKSMQFGYTAKLDKVKYGINIYKYDGNMKEVKRGAVQAGDKSFGPFQPAMTLFEGNILVFYYQVSEGGGIQLLYSTVDPESLDFSVGKLLYTISEKNVGLFKLEKAFENNKLRLCESPDGTQLLVSQSGNVSEIFSCVIKADLSVDKAVVSKVKANLEDFSIGSILIDGEGNRFFSYSNVEDYVKKFGIFVRNAAGKEGFLTIRADAGGAETGRLGLLVSKDQKKVFAYGASSAEHLEEGVIWAPIDADGIKVGKAQQCPFPMDLRDRLRKMDYTQKHYDWEQPKQAFYMSCILEDGTMVISGFPIYDDNRGPMVSPGQHYASRMTKHYAGPIFNIFIKDGNFNLGVVYRNQKFSQASMPIVIPYGGKLICVYTDSEKGINSDDPHTNDKLKDEDDLVLAAAVLSNDGKIISRKKLADRVGSANFFTEYWKPQAQKHYLIPLGRNRVNLARFFSELEGWATLAVE